MTGGVWWKSGSATAVAVVVRGGSRQLVRHNHEFGNNHDAFADNTPRWPTPSQPHRTAFCDGLSHYLNVVRDGQEVTDTNHGRAVARLVPLDQPRALDHLVAEGLVTPAPAAKRSRTPLRVTAKGTVGDLVAEQRQ